MCAKGGSVLRMTMKEIARLAGVSMTTVSKVLNNRDVNVSDATRTKVLSIAQAYHYVPNHMAKSLRKSRSSTLGIVLPDITNPFFAQIARGVEDAAQTRQFGVVFCDTDNRADREHLGLTYLTSKTIDGIILAQSLNPSNLDFLPPDLPLVIIDRLFQLERPGETSAGKIYTDTFGALRALTRLQIQAGCRRLALISAQPTSQNGRYYGFLQGLREYGLDSDPTLVFFGGFDIETGQRGTRCFLDRGADFDGIVCGNDLIALGALDTLRDAGIAVPGQVRLTGLDDIPFARYMTPPLTTARQDACAMGRAAADMLIDHIVSRAPLRDLRFPFEILRRGTV